MRGPLSVSPFRSWWMMAVDQAFTGKYLKRHVSTPIFILLRGELQGNCLPVTPFVPDRQPSQHHIQLLGRCKTRECYLKPLSGRDSCLSGTRLSY